MARISVTALLRVVLSQMIVAVTVTACQPQFHLPLFTNSSPILDSSGTRVRLACVSWAGHMEAGVPEGLHKNNVHAIAALIKSTGFNCVRLTSSTWLWTRPAFGSTTLADSLRSLNLTSAIAGVETHNPTLLNEPLRTVHKRVVQSLASHDLMVILDNHVSKPQWCCSDSDGNGFWGDEFFDEQEWLQGLITVAAKFRSHSHVVGMSLRNELRGPKQNGADWQAIVSNAAGAVHAENPDVLVIAGGLSYASDLSFLTSGSGDAVASRAPKKFVFEFHWYKWFARSGHFDDSGDEDACARNVEVDVLGKAHAHAHDEQGVESAPHFLSEFGVSEQPGALSYGDGRFLDCVVEYLRAREESWAVWAVQGSYYRRNGKQDFEESFGVLDFDWHAVRNPDIVARLRPIQG